MLDPTKLIERISRLSGIPESDMVESLEVLGMQLLGAGAANLYGDLQTTFSTPPSTTLVAANVIRVSPDGWHVATQLEADLATSLAVMGLLRRGDHDLLANHTTTGRSDAFTAGMPAFSEYWEDVLAGVVDQLHKEHPIAGLNLVGILAKHKDPSLAQQAAELVFDDDRLLGRYAWAVINRCGMPHAWNLVSPGFLVSPGIGSALMRSTQERINFVRSRLLHEKKSPLDAVSGHIASAFLTTIEKGIRRGEPRQMSTSEIIRVLFLASNPRDTDSLRLGEECRIIAERIRSGDCRDRIEFLSAFATRYSDVPELLLRYRPHVVQFSGHGSRTGEIVLEDSAGNMKPLLRDALYELLHVLKDNIRCVVLNACYSESQARCLIDFIDCVIGVSRSIPDSEAVSFASGFYRAIAYGRDLPTAFRLGRAEVIGDSGGGGDLVTMFVRAGVEQDALVL